MARKRDISKITKFGLGGKDLAGVPLDLREVVIRRLEEERRSLLASPIGLSGPLLYPEPRPITLIKRE